MWRPDRGKQAETLPEDLDGKVITSITVESLDRHTRKVSIVIIERQTEATVFKAEYQTSQKEHIAYENARDIVKQFVRANDYYIELETTNVQKASVHTVKRFR